MSKDEMSELLRVMTNGKRGHLCMVTFVRREGLARFIITCGRKHFGSSRWILLRFFWRLSIWLWFSFEVLQIEGSILQTEDNLSLPATW